MASKRAVKIVLCWYQPEEWEKLKRTAADADVLDDTYEDWLASANQAIQTLHAEGQQVRKINVKIEALAAWCETQGKANNLAARSQYAADAAKQRSTL